MQLRGPRMSGHLHWRDKPVAQSDDADVPNEKETWWLNSSVCSEPKSAINQPHQTWCRFMPVKHFRVQGSGFRESIGDSVTVPRWCEWSSIESFTESASWDKMCSSSSKAFICPLRHRHAQTNSLSAVSLDATCDVAQLSLAVCAREDKEWPSTKEPWLKNSSMMRDQTKFLANGGRFGIVANVAITFPSIPSSFQHSLPVYVFVVLTVPIPDWQVLTDVCHVCHICVYFLDCHWWEREHNACEGLQSREWSLLPACPDNNALSLCNMSRSLFGSKQTALDFQFCCVTQ